MRNALELIAGAAIATTVGLASAQMTPSMSSSPSSKTDPGTAATSSPSATSNDAFIKLDTDKDGVISKKEASKNKALTAKFDTLDTNKDGKLDQGEFAAFEGASGSSAPKY